MKTPEKNLKLFLFLKGLLTMLLISPVAEGANYYWVNGKGNWSDNFNHWALTSGGNAFHTGPPGYHDNVFFDINSFNQPGDTVFMNLMVANCNTMNWTGVQHNPVFYFSYNMPFSFNPFEYNLRIHGSLILDYQMTWAFSGNVGFVSNLAGNSIITNGTAMYSELIFNNPNGGWFLSDSLIAKSVELKNGNLNTNNQYVSCKFFRVNSYLASYYLFLGSSEIRCTDSWDYAGDADKINASNATISFDESDFYYQSGFYSTDSVEYYHVVFHSSGSIETNKKYNIKKLIFEKNAYLGITKRIADTLLFNNPGYIIAGNDGNNTLTGGKYTEVNGTCNDYVVFDEIDFIQSSGTAVFNYCDFNLFTCSGNATFTANNCFPSSASAVNYNPAAITDLYWVGNSGNWNDPAHWSATSGGAGGAGCLPTPFTNVHIDNNSFSSPGQTITVDSSARIYCYNFNWTNVQPNSTFFSEDSLSRLSVHRDFNLVSAINFSFRGSAYLKSDTIGSMIHTGNNLLNCVQFVADGFATSTFTLDDSLKVKGDLNILTGDLIATGSYISCRYLNCTSGIFSNSRIDVRHGLTGQFNGSGIKVYIYDNPLYNYPSIYNLGGIISSVECFGNFNLNSTVSVGKIILHGDAIFYKAINVDTVIFNSPGHSITFTPDPTGTYQIDHFEANGDCEKLISIQGVGAYQWTTPNIVPNALISYAYISNFPVSTGITVDDCINQGGNTGITFSPSAPAQNLYWIGGSGRWDDGSHWSYSSGGSPALCAPAFIDNVFFDANSFSAPGQTVYVPRSFYRGCNSMNWTGAAFTPAIVFDTTYAVSFYITGSLTLIPQMSWGSNVYLTFEINTAAATITSAGHDLGLGMGFRTSAAYGYSLMDPLTCSGNIGFINGKFRSNNHPIHANGLSVYSSNWQIVNANFGTSYIQLDEFLNLRNTLGIQTTDLDSAIIETFEADLTDNLVTIKSLTFNKGYYGYYGIGQSGHIKKMIINGDAQLNDNVGFIIDTLLLQNPEYKLRIQDSLTVSYLSINGDPGCERYCSIEPYLTTNAALIVPNGFVSADYVELKNIQATGGAIFIADHCRDLGGNTGWNINSITGANDFYWIGGQGNWSDPQHWSLTSGGGSAGCYPTKYDNVHFDANSFSSVGDTVFVDNPYLYFNDMDWTGAQHSPTIAPYNNYVFLTIGGSLIVDAGINFGINRSITFTANDSDNVIKLSCLLPESQSYDYITFSGSGEWELYDSLSVSKYYIDFKNGSLRTNNFLIRAIELKAAPAGSNKIHLDLGSSDIYSRYICKDTSQVDLTALDAKFHSGSFTGGKHQEYGYVEAGYFGGDTSHIRKGVCIGYETELPIYSNIDTLVFSDNLYRLSLWNDVYISGKWMVEGSQYHPVLIKSGSPGTSYTITKLADTLCFDNLFLQDVTITGGVTAFAGFNSINLGNNSGWTFTSCAILVDSVWPGDANYDLVANNVDVLNIGVAYGAAGPVRSNPVITWTPQFATDWNSNFNSGFNYKHADCNGDGVVDNNDTAAINLNYGLVHAFKPGGLPPQLLTAPPLYLVASVDSANLSQVLDIDVFLGLATLPVDSIYGIAFSINFNPALVDTNSLTFDYTGSWLGMAGNDMLTYEKSYASSGYVDLAMVRTDHANTSGYGFLGRMGVVIVDNVAGKMNLAFTLSNVTSITYDQSLLDFNLAGDSISVDTTAILTTGHNPGNEFRVFPVPARENLYIYSTGAKIEKIELYSLYGELIYSSRPVSHSQIINTSGLRNGIYLLKCFTPQGMINKRVEVIHN